MALTLLLLGTLINIFVFTDAQSVGVCYGTYGNNLPSVQDVVNLYRTNGITRMRIYGPNPDTFRNLSGTNIELILDVPNDSLDDLTNQNNANIWVRDNVVNYYPNVRFRYISVGNEVNPNNEDTSKFARFVLPAMINVQNALSDAGLASRIKVSTATYTGLLQDSYPPSACVFRNRTYIEPIIKFLVQNGSPMLANIYPYFAYIGSPNDIHLSFALFTNSTPAYSDGDRQYFNLFYAMYDAHYAAQSRLGGANLEIVVSESGWPSGGKDGDNVATLENARTYYTNLISHVKSSRGTPARPRGPIETYLFAMFDENDKKGELTEQHFGVFSPHDQRSKYQLSF